MIYIGADHQGFELKEKIKKWFTEKKVQFEDCGALVYNKDDDYPDFAKSVCFKTLQNQNNIGILICATGIGMSIAANKYKNIQAALCCSEQEAKQAREHNNANILCLNKNSDYKDIIREFVKNKFTEKEKHIRRIKKINHES